MKRKFLLEEKDIPENWYNIIADMPNKPLPPLHPASKEPIGPDALAPLFPMELIKQEVTTDKYVPIPDEVETSIPYGALLLSTEPTTWKKCWIPLQKFTTNTKVLAPLVLTNPIQQYPKPITIKWKA